MVARKKKTWSGECTLLLSILLNSFGVALQVKSGIGISCISSVSYVLSKILPLFSFGTWNYLIQIFVLLMLVVLTRRFRPGYCLSLVLSVFFGRLLDLYSMFLPVPSTLPLQLLCYAFGLFTVCVSIWMLQRCMMPILPFDTFARDMTEHFHLDFRLFKTGFDLTLLTTSVVLSLVFCGGLVGIGLGTVLSAFLTGSLVSSIAGFMDQRISFRLSFLRA